MRKTPPLRTRLLSLFGTQGFTYSVTELASTLGVSETQIHRALRTIPEVCNNGLRPALYWIPTRTLRTLVEPACDRAMAKADPFFPSAAQFAEELQPVVNAILAMPKPEQVAILRTCRPGTWDMHVLAECKSSWSLDN